MFVAFYEDLPPRGSEIVWGGSSEYVPLEARRPENFRDLPLQDERGDFIPYDYASPSYLARTYLPERRNVVPSARKKRFPFRADRPSIRNGCLVFQGDAIDLPTTPTVKKPAFVGLFEAEEGGPLLFAWKFAEKGAFVVRANSAWTMAGIILFVRIPFGVVSTEAPTVVPKAEEIANPVEDMEASDKRFSLVVAEIERKDKGE